MNLVDATTTGHVEASPTNEPKRMKFGDIPEGAIGGMTTDINVLRGSNLGYPTMITALPLGEIYRMSLVGNREQVGEGRVSQRPLDLTHARKMARYLLKGLVDAAISYQEKFHQVTDEVLSVWKKVRDDLGPQPYASLQPMVVNIRQCLPGGSDIDTDKVPGFNVYTAHLTQAHKLWVIDGQHRRKGMEIVFNYLEDLDTRTAYPKRSLYSPSWTENDDASMSLEESQLWKFCFQYGKSLITVAVEIHLGLSLEQERQLFHDLNRLVKKIDVNMALDFDNSNPINLFTNNVLDKELHLKIAENEIKDWDKDDGSMARKDVSSINARLFLNKTNINGATGANLNAGQEVAREFWEQVLLIPGFGQEGAHKKTVAAQPVMLKAIAKLVFDFMLHRSKPEHGEEYFNRLMNALPSFDFSHENPMWRYYDMTEAERLANGISSLSNYLPSEETGNRDIGSYQEGENVFRFGSKHNDIFPILGDMIRWKLNLPARTKK